jgi:hypothetical protein
MNLEVMGLVSEFIATACVVASLVYLSVQIRGNESATRAATTQELLSQSTDMLLSHASNDLYVKMHAGMALSEMEKIRLDILFFGLFSHFNDAHYQHLSGKLDSQIWQMYNARTRKNVCNMQDFDRWWHQYRENFTEPFQEYIEDVKEECLLR